MQKYFWLFENWLGGGKALFLTKQEAEDFRKKIDISLIQDPMIGEAMDKEEYDITKVELNPDFEKWMEE